MIQGRYIVVSGSPVSAIVDTWNLRIVARGEDLDSLWLMARLMSDDQRAKEKLEGWDWCSEKSLSPTESLAFDRLRQRRAKARS